MPDLLLELRSEEIPARMQRKAAGDLRKLVTDALVEAGLHYDGAREYWTPRRLTLDIRGLSARSADQREERKGPRTDATAQAIEGFLRGAGLTSIDQAEKVNDPKKGEFYVAVISKPGRSAEAIVADVMPGIIHNFPWPKSMRSGAASAKPGSMRWVRPLQSIVCTYGPETEETAVIAFEVDGIVASNITYGHRFHAPGAIVVRRFEDYVTSLHSAKVLLDAEQRKQIILSDARNIAFASGLELVEDEGLLEEVAGLVEWPQVLMGSFEKSYLEIPAEIIRLTIKTNQKCFVCRRPGSEGLANRFILVANIEASDGGEEIIHGNGKVVAARLSDAAHFFRRDQTDLPDLVTLEASAAKFNLDLKKPLDQRMAKLDHLNVTFHAKLGTQGQRVERIRALAAELTDVTGADKALVDRAAVLAKADLRSEAVGEFPELQGLMGRKYALLQGETASVAEAIEDHYKPQGPSDRVPSNSVAITVALADKLDTLVGFWAIDEKPTGSKDPYALRRAALGIIRILIENRIRMPLLTTWNYAWTRVFFDNVSISIDPIADAAYELASDVSLGIATKFREELVLHTYADRTATQPVDIDRLVNAVKDLLSFFHDRLKVYLRDTGMRHDIVDAVLTEDADDLLMVVRRAEALAGFITSDDGINLLAGTKRATQLLATEEKKGTRIAETINENLLLLDAEKALNTAIKHASVAAAEAVKAEDFGAAMVALSHLRGPVDQFFTDVLVNDENLDVRANRLCLLAKIRAATATVADFSKIAG